MSMGSTTRLVSLVVCTFLSAACWSASAESRKIYKHLSVEALEVADKTDFPPDLRRPCGTTSLIICRTRKGSTQSRLLIRASNRHPKLT
jgi:hypothetical protein